MSLRKRISSSRERRAQARAKRREEQRRAERAKETATASQRATARSERRAAAAAEKARAAAAKGGRKAEAEPRTEAEREPRPESEPRPKRGPDPKREPESKPEARRAKVAVAAKPKSEPKSKPGSRAGRSVAAEARKLGGGIGSVLTEVLKLGREMLAIPVQLWIRAAEVAGAVVLKAWQRFLRPLLLAIWRLLRAALAFAERHLTPARAVAVVAAVAAVALAASQWLDYHAVSVGTDAYSGTVGEVAPPPEVESEIAGNAHGWVMLPLALAALIALVAAVSGRRRAAALMVPIGVVVIVVAVAVDVPKGLDEGSAAVAYEGAKASLLEGFWVQIAAAAVLIACGLLLPRYLRPATARTASERLTGPSLFTQLAAAVRKRPRRPWRLPRPRVKRKIEQART